MLGDGLQGCLLISQVRNQGDIPLMRNLQVRDLVFGERPPGPLVVFATVPSRATFWDDFPCLRAIYVQL